MRHFNRRRLTAVVTAVAVAAVVSGCGGGGAGESGSRKEGDLTVLELWTHNGGNTTELNVVNQIVKDFNKSQSDYKVEVQAFPQDSYNDSVTAAASAKKLPCIMDIDAPIVPNWAWAGYLKPLDLSDEVTSNLLPTALGKVNGDLYSFGYYDVSLTMLSRRSVLHKAGIRIPTVERPWTREEFEAALDKLKATGDYTYPLDLGTGGKGEWIPYGYSPILQSFGGDLLDRDSMTTADGMLNGHAALAWAEWMQHVITAKYAARKSGADSTADFVNGKTAIVYTGSWSFDAATKKYGKDAVFLPPPDFGNGPKVGGGSWQWGVSSGCAAPEGAQAYMRFAANPKYFVAFANALGLIPVDTKVVDKVRDYAPGGDAAVFLDFAKKYAVIRPPTAAYPFISSTFQKATLDILAGGDPKSILDKATEDIDDNIKQNGNYEF
jgi:multiple sugar transport system substrate-binding protein